MVCGLKATFTIDANPKGAVLLYLITPSWKLQEHIWLATFCEVVFVLSTFEVL